MAANDPIDFLYVGTYGPEDPTRATLVFAAAIRMRAKGKAVKVALLGQGVLLMNDTIARGICVVGQRADQPGPRTIYDLMAAARTAGVEIHC
jgi:predicted peroxiredoxin